MFKHYFERIQNVEIYPIISLVIFFVFFISLLFYVWVLNKKYIHKMSNMPLEADTSDNNLISKTYDS